MRHHYENPQKEENIKDAAKRNQEKLIANQCLRDVRETKGSGSETKTKNHQTRNQKKVSLKSFVFGNDVKEKHGVDN